MFVIMLLSMLVAHWSLAQRGGSDASEEETRLLLGSSPRPRIVPCKTWQGATGSSLYSMALHPSMIGDATNNKRCKIIDARKCSSCHCDYYVRYSEDGGSTWLGLTFEGLPGLGGTGCPGYGMTSATQIQAIAWLQDEHINKGRCGCKPQISTCKWTNWIDRDNESGKGDYEFDPALKNKCKVEKYEVSLVSGGPIYSNVGSVLNNVVSYNPTYTDGPMIYCVNAQQPKCKTNGQGYKIGPSPPCCLDYKARFCCKVGLSKPNFEVLKPFRGGK